MVIKHEADQHHYQPQENGHDDSREVQVAGPFLLLLTGFELNCHTRHAAQREHRTDVASRPTL